MVEEASTLSSTPSTSQSFSQHASSASTSPMVTPSAYKVTAPNLWMPTAPPFHVPPRMSGPAVMPGPPGMSTSTVLPPISATTSNSSSTALPRPIPPAAPLPYNPTFQHHTYPPYTSVPTPAALSNAPWFSSPQLSGLARPPFVPHPASFPVPYPLPPRGVPLPSIPLPDVQPPGVTPVGPFSGSPAISVASGSLPSTGPGIQPQEALPGTGGTAVGGIPDAWTAHKSEAGAVYYYNALTGESTYDKPTGYKGELDSVTSQPTPVSWEKIAGTDWSSVITNNGKKYYYNSITKVSSWQVPDEVTQSLKKKDVDALSGQQTSVVNSNLISEKGSASISLSASAVNTGGRDATALRPSTQMGSSSSALDLIKRKLQDSGVSPPAAPSPVPAEANGSKVPEETAVTQSENNKDKIKDTDDGDGNMSDSSSDSEDVKSGPTKDECEIQFKEMLKERGVAPFSKWDKELPKIVFDPRFKAVQSYSARRALFEHYVRTRAEEERKEKRAAHKAAVEGFKQLLEEAKVDIDHNTDYQTFKKKWGHDPRFELLDRKDREILLNERVYVQRRANAEKNEAIRATSTSNFKAMLFENASINLSSRWSKVKDSLRSDPRYKSVAHEDREVLFNEYISEMKLADEEANQAEKVKQEEQEKLKERERATRKRKEREEQEVERVRSKARRKEAIESYQALLVEIIKDPRASWTESKPKLEKDPQGRAASPHLDKSDFEKLFREHVKILYERCVQDFKALLSEVVTPAIAAKETEDGKTAANSWSTAKNLLKVDVRYAKMPRGERESLWRRHVEEMRVRAEDDKEERERESKGHSRSRR